MQPEVLRKPPCSPDEVGYPNMGGLKSDVYADRYFDSLRRNELKILITKYKRLIVHSAQRIKIIIIIIT